MKNVGGGFIFGNKKLYVLVNAGPTILQNLKDYYILYGKIKVSLCILYSFYRLTFDTSHTGFNALIAVFL